MAADASDSSAPPRRHTVSGGHVLAFDELGGPDGFPVLFFHGTPASRLNARFLAGHGAPARAGARVIAVDRPGIGGSSPWRATPHAWGDAVRQLLDALEVERAALLGHSGGGPYAIATAIAAGARVSAVAVVAGSPLAAAGASGPGSRSDALVQLCARHPRVARAALGAAAAAIRRGPATMGRLAPMLLGAADRVLLRDPRWRALLIAMLDEAFTQGPQGVVRDAALLARPWDLPLERLAVPVDLWYGAADRNVPAAVGERLAGFLPGARLHVLPSEGHLTLLCRHGEAILRALVAGSSPR